jgi:hypothetical protein
LGQKTFNAGIREQDTRVPNSTVQHPRLIIEQCKKESTYSDIKDTGDDSYNEGQREKTDCAYPVFQRTAQAEQSQHVEQDVKEGRVVERRREQPINLQMRGHNQQWQERHVVQRYERICEKEKNASRGQCASSQWGG